MEKGKLYLIATPIGNLEDITLRAIETLKKVDIIAAEDTRQSLKLLNHFKISKPLESYHRHNEETKTRILINKMVEGKNIGLITDAGTPGISDPGEILVKEAIKNMIDIIPIPGACAAINALIISGLSTREFVFYGFLPTNKKLRKEKFKDITKQDKTIILYEAPHRLIQTLEEIRKEIGDIDVVIAKELTKIHEKVFRNKISDFILSNKAEIKGEYIIMFENHYDSVNDSNLMKLDINEQYNYYEKLGLDKKSIIKQIAKNEKVNKDIIYKKFI